METKTLISMLLCYHVATKNQQISRFDKNFQNVNGQNQVQALDTSALFKNFDRTHKLLQKQSMHLITLVLFQLVYFDVNSILVPLSSLLKDFLLHTLNTHILGAILADEGILQAQIFLHVIYLGVFNCCHRFLFAYVQPTLHSAIQDLILTTILGFVLLFTLRIFIQNALLKEQVSENSRVQQIVDANLAFRQQEMTVIPFRHNSTQGLQLCRKSPSFRNKHSIDQTLELLKSLSFRASLRGHEQNDIQSGEVRDLNFPTIESIIEFILTQAEGKVLAGTATENYRDETAAQTYQLRNFSFAIIVSEGTLHEFLLGLKLDNSQESISSCVSSRLSRKKTSVFTQTENEVQPSENAAGEDQEQVIQEKEDSDSAKVLNFSSGISLMSNSSQLPHVATPKMGPLSDIIELESKENYMNSEYREDASANPSSQQKNVFFHSSHVDSELGDGEISVLDRVSDLREKCGSSKIISKNCNRKKFKAQPLSKSLSQNLLENTSKTFKGDEEESSSPLSRYQNIQGSVGGSKLRKRSSSNNHSSIANINSAKQTQEIADINIQLVDQINKLKAQIETNKIFTFMIVHDLKHPTESLIDSLQFVMRALRKLEETFYSLSQAEKDIKRANSSTFAKLQEVRAQLDSLRLDFRDIASDRISQDQESNNIWSKNRSERSRFSQLVGIQEKSLKGQSAQNFSQIIQHSDFRISQDLGGIIIEESKEESRDFSSNNQVNQSGVEQNDQSRRQSVTSDLSSTGTADFDEGVTEQNIGKFIRNSSKNLFLLAGQNVHNYIVGEKEGSTLHEDDNKQSKRTFSPIKLCPSASQQRGQADQNPANQDFNNLAHTDQEKSDQVLVSIRSEKAPGTDQVTNPTRGASDHPDDVSFGVFKRPEQRDSNIDIRSHTQSLKQEINELIENQQQTIGISEGLTGQISNCQSQIQKAIDTVNTLNYTSEMMRNLMMDLLDLAQMEKNTFKLNKDFFSIFDVISKAFMLLDHVSNKQQVTLKMPEVNDVNEVKLYQQIYGDKNRFLQVIINFLSNSLKFSKQGSEIHLHLKILENHVLASSEFRGKGFETSLCRSRSVAAISNIINDSEDVKSLSAVVISSHQDSEKTQNSQSLSDNVDVRGSSSGFKRVTVSEHKGEKTSYIEFMLSIQDFGIGIPADKINNLFINFGNLEEHQKTNPQGRGLGLSICKSIVEQMGGKVIVESELGKGSTFSMTFKVMCKVSDSHTASSHMEYSLTSPLLREETPRNLSGGLKNKKQEELQNSLDTKKPRLLLVNDTQFLLYSYELQLEETFQITTAENGLQALQIVTSEPPNFFDIILLDINMPIMDGFEACSRITDYLYQEDSFFSINPSRVSFKDRSSNLIQTIDSCTGGQLMKSQSHAMLDKIHPLPRALLVSSKNAVRGDFSSDDVNIDGNSASKMRPLIYALTGDVSTQTMEKIKSYPFMGVFEKIGVEEAKFILDQIDGRNDVFQSQHSQPKKGKRKPRPAQSQQNILNQKSKISKEIERDDIDYLNVILEDDEQACESSNSVSSVEEEKVFEFKQVNEKSSGQSFNAMPYNNGLPRVIDVGKMHKMVNFIRKKSSDNKLSFFRPLAESVLPFDSLVQQQPVLRTSQSMQNLEIDQVPPKPALKDRQQQSQSCLIDKRQPLKGLQIQEQNKPEHPLGEVELTIRALDSSNKALNSENSVADFQSSQVSQVSPLPVSISNHIEDSEFSFRDKEL